MHTTAVQTARLSVGKASSRQRFGSIGGAAPPNAENLTAVHLVVAVPSPATRTTVALAWSSAAFVPRLIEQSQCKPKHRPPD
jgi:hypothetical protein